MSTKRQATPTPNMRKRNIFQILILIIFIYIITILSTHYSTFNAKYKEEETETKKLEKVEKLNKGEIKYILQWTNKSLAPFNFMGEGNSSFVKNKCKFQNCYVTNNSQYLKERGFDAIAFNGREMMHLDRIPKYRDSRQKYIFGAMESADNFPVCDEKFDNFFNWTWTYKLDSDFRWGYVTIYDLNGDVVGPAVNMKWESDMKPINESLKLMLSKKTKAAAWFVSHCSSKSGREKFADEVQKELERYGLGVDVYGRCGALECPKANRRLCNKMIKEKYYFYFSFENSFAEDYVTEKLLNALQNYAVPVVYGAANYSRFLPPGSYLDGKALGPRELARQMNEIIKNPSLFHDFFRWRNYYVYKETSSKEDICKLCEMLNDEEKVSETSVWKDFRSWWNGARYEHNCNRRTDKL